MMLYEGDDFVEDVKQGALGDCYFPSALSVIGEKLIKECIITKEEETSCGAYLVRFFNDNKQEEYVIVDDLFPIDEKGNWAFVKSENPKELWPMILEKAYAKLYGSYQNIEAGKVSYALVDLTGGVPEQIRIEDESNDFDTFCKKVYKYYKSGYLMGAGSTANAMGDSVAINGIVQGHAYSILEVSEYENDKIGRAHV